VTTSEPSVSDVLIAQPRALIVTIYGMYARDTGGWFSIAALIKLMAELGVDEPAVRSAISRLKVRGLLESGPVGGAAGYGLSAGGRKILSDGDRRIFRRPRASTDDGWLLAVFSVPEQQRARRHALRSRLAWLGFGTVSAGVWIAPPATITARARTVSRGPRRPRALRPELPLLGPVPLDQHPVQRLRHAGRLRRLRIGRAELHGLPLRDRRGAPQGRPLRRRPIVCPGRPRPTQRKSQCHRCHSR